MYFPDIVPSSSSTSVAVDPVTPVALDSSSASQSPSAASRDAEAVHLLRRAALVAAKLQQLEAKKGFTGSAKTVGEEGG